MVAKERKLCLFAANVKNIHGKPKGISNKTKTNDLKS
jgi:hypothetical protein